MDREGRVQEIQKRLREQQIDGWLLFDHHGSNKFVYELFFFPQRSVITRRFFYWIPQEGEPIKILHKIEEGSLDFLPGKVLSYLSWIELEKILKNLLKKVHKIAMEYSTRNAKPYVAVVDGGTLEWIRESDVEIISSSDLLQHLTSVLDARQIDSHIEAVKALMGTLDKTWDLIVDHLQKGKRLTEYDVQKFILSEFAAQNVITEDGPVCAVNEHSALPHYMATKESAKTLERGDLILIDLWGKKAVPYGVYADITRVAVTAPQPSPKQQEIFCIVKEAQQKAIELVFSRFSTNKPLKGSEVDDVCRKVIAQKGLENFFPHRTGHNMDTSLHGSGAHLDNFEVSDQRIILPGTCFTIEPGIYLPGEFGIRLESDILIDHHSHIKITDEVEKSLLCLL